VLAAVAWLGTPRLEDALRRRLEAGARRHGWTLRIDALRVRPWRPLVIAGLRLDGPGGASLALDGLEAAPRHLGAGLFGLRVDAGRAVLAGPAGLAVELEPTRWDVAAAGHVYAALRGPVGSLELSFTRAGRVARFAASAHGLRAERLLAIRRNGLPLVDPGVLDGVVRVSTADGTSTFDAAVRGAGTRVAALANDGDPASGAAPVFGEPADLAIGLEGHWRADAGVLDLRGWSLASAAARVSGTLQVAGLPADPAVDLSLHVERVDFARLFRASGLDQPLAVATSGAGLPGASNLGAVEIRASARGRLADPGSFDVSQQVDFTPPRRPVPAIEKLRGDFAHEVTRRGGGRATILVSPASPDFVALDEVPPLFVRTLLIGEDSGFFGHRGVDLSALPEAILTNWARGGAVRGASTITQQLAKNLFLSGERRLGRKVQELCLALLLEAALDKQRILEIYLNVIEWGPDLYGLRPAARRYFGRDPAELTPKQMAFLVALVPGPIKYQRSLRNGGPSPAFQRLVDNLLAKLRSVDALTEEEYQAALAEPLIVGPAAAPGDEEMSGNAPSS
jgi:hypothetical protein